MKRILVYFHENDLAPIGGPAGYLYNLRKQLTEATDDDVQIEFLPPVERNDTAHVFLRRHTPVRGQEFVRALSMTKLSQKRETVDEKYRDYDAIHFHSTQDMYFCRGFLEKYAGIVLLTSHTPCVSFAEKLDRLNGVDRKLFGKKLESLKQIDQYAFERADHIIFPCEEAEEPYYHTWEEYADIRDARKYIYIPTGINACSAKMPRNEVRQKYGIPQNAFVVSFVGRHNEIKGYADLKRIGARLLAEGVWFLIAGNETPIRRLSDPHWIEVGWTKDPHSIINAADVFILPNRETYFDLILLEALSLGQIIIGSSTGGNKYFCQYGVPGILTYDRDDGAIAAIKSVCGWDQRAICSARAENKRLFEREFTTEIFAKRYKGALKELFR